MKWPKTVKHRNKVLAVIYRKSESYPFFRVAYQVDGRRMMKSFANYSGEDGAKQWADARVRELAKGSKAAALTARQADDALAALRHLQTFYEATGKRVSLLEGISGYCGAVKRLGHHTLSDVAERFLSTEAVVQRKALAESVAEFIQGRKHLAESNDGKRSKRSPVYTYNVAMWLNEFAKTFPGYAVCDLTKEHLNAYIGKFKELSAKSRNDRRAVVKMFLRWCVAKDYLALAHRLFEAVDFKTEDADSTEIDYYRPKELRDMLDNAGAELMPVIALGGLAGLRREEILRLEWSDAWRVKGKVEISARIAKGRKRRLVTICPALAAWLRSYRLATGQVWSKSADALEDALAALRDDVGIPARRNGLRHSFISFHMAMHSNENLTAAEAGNSPQMIHDHYRALATRKEAEKWFGIRPVKAAKRAPAKPAANNSTPQGNP
jgi:integrase